LKGGTWPERFSETLVSGSHALTYPTWGPRTQGPVSGPDQVPPPPPLKMALMGHLPWGIGWRAKPLVSARSTTNATHRSVD